MFTTSAVKVAAGEQLVVVGRKKLVNVHRLVGLLCVLCSACPLHGQEVDFADAALDSAVRVAASAIGPPGDGNLKSVVLLTATDANIRSLQGIERLVNLEVLDLGGNRISDLSPLSTLEYLEFLNLESNLIVDLTPLAAMDNLKFLLLDANHIEDIEPLVGLPSLASAYLLGNPLNSRSTAVHVPALQARGVEVFFERSEDPGGGDVDMREGWAFVGPVEPTRSLDAHDVAVAPGIGGVVYALMENGLWRSRDLGLSWEITGMMHSGPVWLGLLMDAVDPDVVYLADHALRSRDGGASWTAMGVPGRLIAADPVATGRLYAVDVERALWESSDGGDTWAAVEARLNAGFGEFLWAHPADPSLLYFGSRRTDSQDFTVTASLLHSSDGGRTWRDLDFAASFAALAPDPASRSALYAMDSSALWHSLDGGETWDRRGGTPSVGLDRLVAHPGEEGWLFAWSTTGTGVYQTNDGGRSWQRIADRGKVVPNPTDPAGAYLVTGDLFTPGQLYSTVDQGRQWSPVAIHDPRLPSLSIAFDGSGGIYVGSESRTGAVSLPVLFWSGDRGGQWRSVITGLPDRLHGGLAALGIESSTGEVVIGQTTGSGFIRSEDRGSTWQQVTLSGGRGTVFPSASIITADVGGGAYYAVDPWERALYRSDDSGSTWTRVRRDVTSFTVRPDDHRTLYAGYRETEDIWSSDDGGSTWNNLGVVFHGETVQALGIRPGDHTRLYAATEKGLYVSRGAETWQKLLDLEGAVPSVRTKIRFSPHSADRLLVMTDRALWESSDGGSTWTSIGDSLAGLPWFHDVAVDPIETGVVYAATPWGLHRVSLQAGPTVVEGAAIPEPEPQRFRLDQNYPNPFNGQTLISYHIPHMGHVRLTLYDVLGQELRRVVDQVQSEGSYRVAWNGEDDAGLGAATGVYLFRLQVGRLHQARRLLLVK